MVRTCLHHSVRDFMNRIEYATAASLPDLDDAPYR